MNKQSQAHQIKSILWIVRHGKTMFNSVERVQGWSDTPLIQEGREVVESLSLGLKTVTFDAAYSSDSGRARETMKILLKNQPQLDDHFMDDWRLRELNFGAFEGEFDHIMKGEIAKLAAQTLEERVSKAKPSIFADQVALLSAQKEQNSLSWPAENYQIFSDRLRSALVDISNHPFPKTKASIPNILIVSHGVAIWALWEMIDELRGYEGGGIKNASVTKISVYDNDTFELISANDLSYLK